MTDQRLNITAQELFEAYYRYIKLELTMVDILLEIANIDLDEPEAWPLEDVTFDNYDTSFEFKQVTPGWKLSKTMRKAYKKLGFLRCWLCYTDKTEKYYGF